MKSNVTLELANGVTILASTNIADYATRGECPVFIYADHATNVAISPSGLNRNTKWFEAKHQVV